MSHRDRAETRCSTGAGTRRAVRWASLMSFLLLSGCAAVDARQRTPGDDDLRTARLQSPGGEAGAAAPPTSPVPPMTPAPNPPPVEAIATDTASDQPAPDESSETGGSASPPAASSPRVTSRRELLERNDPSLQGLSSIARNRRIHRMLEDQVPEEPDFPDLRDDPLGRAGVPIAERDPFPFPWLMNLIYEDRWGLETNPTRARSRRIRKRATVDIRDPDPDTANFPNGAYTLPKGRLYIETSPVGFYGPSKVSPRIYQWNFLTRYGLTDNLEFRIFSNGLTVQGAKGKQPATTGFSPLAFDFKANFWEENTRYHVPAVGLEVYLQTTFGSPSLSGGTQPSMNLLFDQSLPLGIGFEWNVGITGVQNGAGQIVYEFSYQWSFQRQVVEDFDIFVHGFYNAAALPRLLNVQSFSNNALPTINVVGVGGIWTVNDRVAIFGSYNFGTTSGSPSTIALLGFAVAF